jgi:hypothetical protein
MVKTPIVYEKRKVSDGGLQIIVVQHEEQDVSWCGNQRHDDLYNNAALTHPGKYRIEEITVVLVRTSHELPVPCHYLELENMIDLKPIAPRDSAKSARADRPADREHTSIDIHGGREPFRIRCIQHRAPQSSGTGLDGRADADIDHANRIQRTGINDDSSIGLSLAEHCVALTAYRNFDVTLVRELNQLHNILDRARLEHSGWQLMHYVSKVIRSRFPRSVIEEQCSG